MSIPTTSKNFFSIIVLLLLAKPSISPPPNRPADGSLNVENPRGIHSQAETASEPTNSEKTFDFPYSQYLEIVVKILEGQPKFQEKIRGMNETDIKSGKIADHLEDLDTGVFDQLTKAKLTEIERIRQGIETQVGQDGDTRNVKMPEHIDVNNWQRFTKEDLRKLIQKTVSDMDRISEERRQKFKEYEMEKKAEQDHKLAQMASDEREKANKEIEESRKRHNEHEKLNHPGGREQLEEVWEERDHMDKENYDPKVFFALHDLNNDGFWNEQELDAIFQIELEKVYNETNPDDDPKEKIEEMYRMREHVVKQMDKNEDRLISLDEFLQDSEAQNNQAKDPGWNDLSNERIYTDEELQKFEKEYANVKGWGDNAYDPTTLATQAASLHNQNTPLQQNPQNYPRQGHLPDSNPSQNLADNDYNDNRFDRQNPQQPGSFGNNENKLPASANGLKKSVDPVYGI